MSVPHPMPILFLGALLSSSACTSESNPPAADPDGGRPTYTEEREPCAAFSPLRNVYFGDLHFHTSLSMDAWIFGTRTLHIDRPPFTDCGEGTGLGGAMGLGCVSRLNYVRNVLLAGLEEEERLGVNPYRLGIVAGTDTHNASPRAVPRFAVLAIMDDGSPEHHGPPLQRIQIIKGWIDAEQGPMLRVFEAAGDPDNGAAVDLETCEPVGEGFERLCTIWRDTGFRPGERAFYYARILENPSCRWST